ncbi:ankyrin [Hypoxylon sp. NC0597]|nr:ankyrin [Hypoxylon sp. NC0597]
MGHPQNKLPPTMSESVRRRPVADVWEIYRKVICWLYIVENRKLKDVADYMKEHYQFHQDPRDYEYRFKKWGVRKNIPQAKRKLIQNEVEERMRQGIASEALQAGLPISPKRMRFRTQPPTLASKYLLNTPHPDGEIGVMSISTQIPCLGDLSVQTPPWFVQKEPWPDGLPWLNFNKKFGALIAAQFSQTINSTLPAYDFQATQDCIVKAGRTSHEIALHSESSIQRLRLRLDLLCPEIHEGDHTFTSKILLTGSRESSSIEFLKLMVYLLSNNMEYELRKFTDGEVEDPVDVLYKFGLLTKANITWLKSSCDETSEALLEKLLPHSLMKDDGNLLRWILGERVDLSRFVRLPYVWGPVVSNPNQRADDRDRFPLYYAAYHESHNKATTLVDLLLLKGAKLAQRAGILWLAVSRGNSSLVLRMMQRGAKISPATFMEAAGNYEMLSLLFDNQDKWTHPTSSCPSVSDMISPSTLRRAIHTGKTDAVRFLIETGAGDPNGIVDGVTHIEYTCTRPWPRDGEDILGLLLENGGLADRPKGHLNRHTSALEIATNEDWITGVKMLLDAGADINFFDSPNKPSSSHEHSILLEALRTFNAELAKLILKYKPQILGPELKVATQIGDSTLMDMLYEAGARLQGDELSALQFRKPEIVNWLIRRGAIIPQTSLLEIALYTHNHEGILTALPHAVYDSRTLFEATSLALKTKQYVFVVEALVSKRVTAARDELEIAALAIAVMNRNSQLCRLLSDPKFHPGSLEARFCWFHPDPWSEDQHYVKRGDDGVFEICPWTSRCTEWDSRRARKPNWHILELAEIFDSQFAVDYAVTDLINLGVFPQNSYELQSVIPDWELNESTVIQLIQAYDKAYPCLGHRSYPSSLLLHAIHEGPGLVKILLDIGVDVNATPEYEPQKLLLNVIGGARTPLQAAVEKCDINIIKQLLDAGAHVNALPGSIKSATSLQIAAMKGHIGIARMLLKHGANVNAPRARICGRTAIEGAAENGRLDMVKMLLLHLQDNGKSQEHRIQFIRAIKFATREGYYVIAKMLKHHIRWNGDDQALYDLIDITKRDIVDEMTQELSTSEFLELKMLCAKDTRLKHRYDISLESDEATEISDYSSDGSDDTDDRTGNVLNETELHCGQIINQEVPIATPTAVGPNDVLGLVPVEGYQDLLEETPGQKAWEEELRRFEESSQQSPQHFPTLNMEECSADVFGGLSNDVFMGVDLDSAIDWEGEGFM